MFRKLKSLLFIFLSFLAWSARAQVNISASIDSTSIIMGQQTVVHFHVSQPQDLALQLPVFSDFLAPEVYIVEISGDTIADGTTITINNDIVITVFEPGDYAIPPFVCREAGKEYATPELKLQVRDWPGTFELSKIPSDIKHIHYPPHSKMLWIVLIISAVLFVLFLVVAIMHLKKHKTDPEPYVRNSAVADSDQPELTALELIRKLVADKAWQPLGNEKKYFTELTDVLRQYFYRRYQINALEMTSSEILAALMKTDCPPALREQVREICFTGDMTKFAKHVPSDEECLTCASLAENIVKKTMLEEKNEAKDKKDKEEGKKE